MLRANIRTHWHMYFESIYFVRICNENHWMFLRMCECMRVCGCLCLHLFYFTLFNSMDITRASEWESACIFSTISASTGNIHVYFRVIYNVIYIWTRIKRLLIWTLWLCRFGCIPHKINKYYIARRVRMLMNASYVCPDDCVLVCFATLPLPSFLFIIHIYNFACDSRVPMFNE